MPGHAPRTARVERRTRGPKIADLPIDENAGISCACAYWTAQAFGSNEPRRSTRAGFRRPSWGYSDGLPVKRRLKPPRTTWLLQAELHWEPTATLSSGPAARGLDIFSGRPTGVLPVRQLRRLTGKTCFNRHDAGLRRCLASAYRLPVCRDESHARAWLSLCTPACV